MRRINTAGLVIAKHAEGLRLKAYLCPAGKWTIGYGHRITAKEGMKITAAEAEMLLRADLHTAEKAVSSLITVPLTDNQFSALVCFTFNLGAGQLRDSTLRRKLNNGDYAAVPAQIKRFIYANGKKVEGLVTRRNAEAALFERA